MFGKNPIVKQNWTAGEQLRVNSIFATIQGEGPFSGTPAIFIRFSDCCLRCYWCDTEFTSGTMLSVAAIISKVIGLLRKGIKTKLIVLTGGEPFVQNFIPLVNALVSLPGVGLSVQMETSGSLGIPKGYFGRALASRGNSKLFIVVSPKTGIVHRGCFRSISSGLAWKYIITKGEVSEDDGLPIYSTQVKGIKMKVARPDYDRAEQIFVQPCDEHDAKLNKANVEEAVRVAMKYGYNISIQQHKLLNLP